MWNCHTMFLLTLKLFQGKFKEIIKVVSISIVDTLTRQRWTPQRAHARTDSAATTDSPQCTTETLTHKHGLLRQQSNLLAWHLTINDYSISLAQSSYPGGTCKSPAIDWTAFDYIHWVKNCWMAIIVNANEAEGHVYWRISAFSSLGLLSVASAGRDWSVCTV